MSYVIAFVCFFFLALLNTTFGISGKHLAVQLAAIYWFVLSQGAKRCHDMGVSGLYQLIPFYVFAMIFSEGQNKKNIYGQDPKLLEVQDAELIADAEPQRIVLPEGKQMEAVGSELLSGVFITALGIALVSYLYDNNGWLYYSMESIVVMAGYYLVLLFGSRPENMGTLTKYFLLHRAVFSLGCYVLFWGYYVYSNNITEINFAAVGNDISYIISICVLTYIPYLIFKTRKTSIPIPIEA